MLKIAVIDDDKFIHQKLKTYLDQFQIAYDFDFQVDYYFSCEDIQKALMNGEEYDLLFLDIEFPEMNGTEFGMLLRRKMKNYDTQIIFLSAVKEYAMELFKIRPIEFLVKPLTYDRVSACMLAFMTHYEDASGFLEYTMENIRHQIRIREVYYLESHAKKVEFHTKGGCFMVYGKMNELIAGCADQFLCISRGEYVNIMHIVEADPKTVVLTDRTVLHISRGRQSAVRDRLSEL